MEKQKRGCTSCHPPWSIISIVERIRSDAFVTNIFVDTYYS